MKGKGDRRRGKEREVGGGEERNGSEW